MWGRGRKRERVGEREREGVRKGNKWRGRGIKRKGEE